MTRSCNKKPCLVETQQGFSVLYENRPLFSKYNPQSSFKGLLEKHNFLPNTLFVCCSPVLSFPVQLLFQQLESHNISDSCGIIGLEWNPDLVELSTEQLSSFSENEKFAFISTKEPITLLQFLEKQNPGTSLYIGNFRHCVFFNCSADALTNKDFYGSCNQFLDTYIAQFWKNRMTLIKLGRLYTRNIFRNIGNKPSSIHKLLPHSLTKIPFVAGAGTTLDDVIPLLHKYRENLCIFAVDASLVPLLKNNITPDYVVAVECQLANEKAFIGAVNSKVPIIADITSRTNILSLTGGNTSLFLSHFSNEPFLERVKKLSFLSVVIPPLGSVGLAAVELALYLKQENDPLFCAGLDFAYPIGTSHCKEAPPIRNSLNNWCRLSPGGNPGSAYKPLASPIKTQTNEIWTTDSALTGYGKLFSQRYCTQKKDKTEIYTLSQKGCNWGLPWASEKDISEFILSRNNEIKETKNISIENYAEEAFAFLHAELNTLLEIKEIFTGKKEVSSEKLQALLLDCSYLYLHFPDGFNGPKLNQDFLNRVRAEIDFFIKDIKKATENL